MEIVIKGEAKEIAALVIAVQERQCLPELDCSEIVDKITDGLRQQLSSSRIPK